jgi:hypothetical protein
MKIKKRLWVFLATLAAIAAMVVTASAQRAGFQAAGIAPPVQHQHMLFGPTPVAPFMMAPVAPFVTAPVAPFGVAPGGRIFETFRGVPPQVFFPPVQPPAVVIPRQFHNHPGFGFGPSFGTPNTGVVIVPQVFPQVIFPESNIGLPPVAPIPTIPPTISTIPPTVSTFPPTISTLFSAGTSRAQVISQLGSPSVTVITSTGETLYFSGGVTVLLQNGQVVTGPR